MGCVWQVQVRLQLLGHEINKEVAVEHGVATLNGKLSA